MSFQFDISKKKNLHSLSNRHPPQTRYRQQMIFRNLLWFSIKYVISVECHMDEIRPQFFDAHFFRIHLTLSQIFMSCIQCVKMCFFLRSRRYSIFFLLSNVYLTALDLSNDNICRTYAYNCHSCTFNFNSSASFIILFSSPHADMCTL